ncbi:MAG: diguanylate cyclase [Aquisalimonadaceae bacterium]
MDLMLDAVCVVNREGYFVFVSAACEQIFGYTAEEMIGKVMIDMVHPDDRARTLQTASEVMSGLPRPHFRNRYIRKDGSVVHIMWTARSSVNQLRIGVARDVTELTRHESLQAALYAISEEAFAADDLLTMIQRIHAIIAGLLPAGSFLVALRKDNGEGLEYLYVADECGGPPGQGRREAEAFCVEIIRNGQALLLAGRESAEKTPGEAGSRGSRMFDWLGMPLRSQKGVVGALVMQAQAGEIGYTEQDQELLQFVSAQIATAIERKQAEIRLRHRALHDPLTDLPNRMLVYDRLENALARARRNGVRAALLFIDLDEFKQVNDAYGHLIGDVLLREVAQRLRECVREADTVGRVGGDEFMVVIEDLGAAEHALSVAEKLRAALERTFDVADHRLDVSSSIGIALYPEHGDDVEKLTRCADKAMYDAKALGGNRIGMAPNAASPESEPEPTVHGVSSTAGKAFR